MAGRQAHGRSLTAKPKAKQNTKAKKRTLDAFAIASHQNPDRIKVKKSRLGAKEGGNRPGKRRREEDSDEEEQDEEEESSKKKRKGPEKGRFDELDLDEGSDSEGNEWKLGQVDSDDDSDLDSDEAFGASDEERFEGYAFSGSTDKKSKKNKKQTGRGGNLNLDEDEVEESDSELEEGDLGEGAVDLADMLNSSSDEEDISTSKSHSSKSKSKSSKSNDISDESLDEGLSSGSGSEEGQDNSDEDSASSADEEDDSANPLKIAALHNIIANLSREDAITSTGAPRRRAGLSLSEPGNQLSTSLASGGKGKKAMAPLAVPLERRQQDRLDRGAAYDKSKETLGRWTDTVKHNREAEHLMFPLPDQDMETAKNNKQLVPTNQSKPFNDLEATIQSILEESGLATANGKDDEDHIREFEELETNKLSVEEVKARRDQLRMARDLLFREEAKSKRIKKIKSKSYRKVHRKQREREERKNQEALAEGGFEPSEDELEAQDRRRAEERMGGKHRNSKWAKAMKDSGRTAWDGDVMSGVTEMARKDEELRKRVEGRVVRKEFNGDSEASISDSDDGSEIDDEAEQQRLLRQLSKIGGDQILDESAPGARLANMKFMKKAEASRKLENNAMVEEIRKELAGESSESEEEIDIGRRLFGPGSLVQERINPKSKENFEEGDNSDAGEANFQGFDDTPKVAASKPKESSKPSHLSSVTDMEATRRRHKKNNEIEVNIDLSQTLTAARPKAKKQPKKIQTLDAGEESSDSENEVRVPFAIKDQDLIRRAFAGADVVGEFDLEKMQTIDDEDEKVVDTTIPGWGSWVGSGVSKKDKQRNKGRFLTKTKGVKASDRKDAKLDRVIINEKKVKKNNKYLTSALPHPFETRAQYERSLRLPIGQEWSTKETFQDATKPRILLKQGVIAPMSKPMS